MKGLPKLSKGNGVPQVNPKLHWVETVDANHKHRFRVWSPAIWEIWTHYNGRTKPCFENHDLCEGGHDESNLRWYGYVFGWSESRNNTAFLQLTEGAARLWFKQIAQGVSLRGMIIDVSRGQSKKGPLMLNVVNYIANRAETLGPDCDPQFSVYRLWKVNHLGQAYKLSLVSGPEDLPDSLESDGCLKTDEGAISFMEAASASRAKKGSKKRKQQA